jgi:hypothetical protein
VIPARFNRRPGSGGDLATRGDVQDDVFVLDSRDAIGDGSERGDVKPVNDDVLAVGETGGDMECGDVAASFERDDNGVARPMVAM